MEFNAVKKREAEGALMSHDDYARPATAMTAAEINKKNEALWGNIGPAPSAAPTAAKELRSVPVYTGGGVGDAGDSTEMERFTRKNEVVGKFRQAENAEEQAKRNKLASALRKSSKPKQGWAEKEFGESKDEVQPTQSAPADPRSDNLLTTEDDLVEGSEAMEHDAQFPANPHYAVSSTASKGTMLGGVKHSTSSSFVKREHAERLAEVNKEINKGAGRETEHKVIAVRPSKRSITPKELGA